CAPGRARSLLAIAAPVRFYRAPPLRRRPGPAPGNPEDPRTAARLYGRLGEASGVPVSQLWPNREQLRALEEEEREWEPSLQDMLAALDRREREEAQRRQEREELIARSLAAMPARISAWRQQRLQAREKARQDAERRQRLLAEAGLTGSGAGTTARAQALLQDLEQKQRREEKRRRRQEREEAARSAMAAAEAAAAAAARK
ncbi:G45IP protein, partial [Semnornis frantzii]|nr:G45IP protein [Semnornis frantzii]